jgi:hypothetical protein
LYESITENKELIDNVVDIVEINNQSLSGRIDYLENALSVFGNGVAYLDFHNPEILSYGENIPLDSIPEHKRAFISNDYNIATLNSIYNDSKTFLTDSKDKEVFLPDDLIVKIEEDSYLNGDIVEKSPSNAFDQNISTAWKRKVVFPKGYKPPSVKATMDIKLPRSIINNMIVNTIFINPFPSNSINIIDVLYKPINSSDYISFKNNGFGFNKIENAGNTTLVFDDIQPSNIKIVFEQNKYTLIDNGDKAMFVLGAQNISVYNKDYTEESSFFIKFDPGISVDRINNIDFIVSNTNKKDVYDFEVYGLNKNINSLVKIDLEKPISYNYNDTFWIKVNLYKDDKIKSPVLKGFVVDYIPI